MVFKLPCTLFISMIASILLVAVALIVLLIATYTDFKTGEIPDWLSYGFIIAALGIRLIHATATSDWMYFLYGVIGFAAVFVFSLLVYYTRQWGGGDAKVMMGLGAAFATAPFAYTSDVPYLLALATNIFIAGGIYGIGWSIYVFAKSRKESAKVAAETLRQWKYAYAVLTLIAFASIIASFIANGAEKLILRYLPVFVLAYMLLYILVKAAEKAGMYERIPVSKLTEGDWIANDIKAKGKLICSRKTTGITIEQIKALKKAGIKSVVIKKGIKFLVALLAGALIMLAYNDIIIFLLFQ